MAEIVFGFGSSHGPQLNMPASQWPLLVEKDQRDPRMDYRELLRRARPGMDQEITPEKMQERAAANERGMARLREKLLEVAPDVIVVVGDDQHEQFLDDNMPMFCVYRGDEMSTARRSGSGRDSTLNTAWTNAAWRNVEQAGVDDTRTYPAAPALGEHLIRTFVDEGVDIACSNRLRAEVGIGHAFSFLYRHILPEGDIPVVPVMVNTFFPPNQPTPKRCYGFGQMLRRGIESWDSDQRVAVMASGGLSHVIVDEEIDRMTIDGLLEKNAAQLCSLPVDRLNLGTSEIRNWIVLAGAVEPMDMTLVDYVPCYRSPAGTGCAMGFAYWD